MRLPHLGARAWLALTVALASLLSSACSCEKSAGAGELTPEVVLARDRAAEFFARTQWDEARKALAPIVTGDDALAQDLVRAAQVELAEQHVEDALPWIRRAAKLAPRDPQLLWAQHRVAVIQAEAGIEGEYEHDLAILEELRRLVPDDVTVHLAFATALDQLERKDEAEREYRVLAAIPAHTSGIWRMTIIYRLGQRLQQTGRESEAAPLHDEFKRRQDQGVEQLGAPDKQPGTLGALRPHRPSLFAISRPKGPSAAPAEKPIPVQGDVRGIALARVGPGSTPEDLGLARNVAQDEVKSWKPETPTLVAWGPGGLDLLRRDPAGSWQSTRVETASVLDVIPFDRKNASATPADQPSRSWRAGDGDLDLLVVVAEAGKYGLRLLENVEGRWSLGAAVLFEHPSLAEPDRVTTSDYDHDGDLDLLLTLADGPRLLRNDGFADQGAFTDATAESGLPQGDFLATPEDLDNDNDIDLLLVERATGKPHLASNERGGRFSDATTSLPSGIQGAHVVAADLDGDAWVDLAVFGDDLALHRRTELGGWRPEVARLPLAARPAGAPRAVDWDLDGTFDLLWPGATAPVVGLLAPGFAEGGVPFELGKPFGAARPGPARLAIDDLDGDHDLDLVRLDSTGAQEILAPGAGRGIGLGLLGYKDNSRGVGAVLEVRSGLRYRRIFCRGTPELVGFGGAQLDVARITWPNGIVQSFFDLDPGTDVLFWQRRGLAGSCPFLYTWNGREFEYVSDVLGITPLGLPMGPGMLVPPDHDEYVLVKGEQLVPKDGIYELQFTEELREVTYLDRIRLDVVDHPSDVEVFPNERFTFPPFPEPHTHTIRDALSPLAALGSDGADWKDELAADDGSFALPFQPLSGQFQGLATPHRLELAFDPERTRGAPKLRLVLNGWFFWTDASVNMAAARDPQVEFVPPLLQVPDGNGGWKECGPIGFPAGKLKTMVVDLSELVPRDDPRLRLFSTLRLYWDSIRLAVDADDAPLVTSPLEPVSALLWERGFSAPDAPADPHGLEWFRWDQLTCQPRWNQHPGLYTRYGETLPLLTRIDDCFVILGAGDALTLRFDASQAPPLKAGWKRDFLVFLDGWAKDRDPNTLEALFVEPLPFHGMSGYPYGPDEHYPDDEEHRAYRREWNTRPARRWIESLVPPRRGSLSPATSQIPVKSNAPATQAAEVGASPSTTPPATPATRG